MFLFTKLFNQSMKIIYFRFSVIGLRRKRSYCQTTKDHLD